MNIFCFVLCENVQKIPPKFQWCRMNRTSNLFHYNAEVRLCYLLKKNSDADVCSYERSVQWTDNRSTIFHWHQQFTQGRASASLKPKSGKPVAASIETSEYDRYMLVDDESLSQRQIALVGISQTIVKKIILSLSFPVISIGMYAYVFTQNIRTGVLFALLGWFFHRWCNKLWATCCFFLLFWFAAF